MDTPIMIIGLLLILIVALPIYYVVRTHKVDTAQIKSLFSQYSQGNKYQFQMITNHGRKVLGMDTHKKGLLFIDFNLKVPYVSFQDLKGSKSCEVATSDPQGKTNTLKKIEMIFASKSGSYQEDAVLFYDANRNYIVPVYAHEELKLAQQWQETIQKHL